MSENKPTNKDVDIMSESVAPQKIHAAPQNFIETEANSATALFMPDNNEQVSSDTSSAVSDT